MAAAGAHRPCPACLSDVPDGATFCPECGQRTRRRSRRGLGLVLGVAGAACVLAAIVVISRHDASREGTGGDFVPRDFVPGDTVPGDTVPGDTVPGDTVPGDTAPAGAVLALDPRFLGENRPPAPGQEAPRGKGGAEAGASLGKGARIAAESLVFLQTFGRGGRLRTETGALLLGGGVGVLPPGVLPGTYFARGWSPSGAYFRVSGVTGSDPETGLARVRVEGRDPGRPARLRIDPPGSEEPVYLLAPRVAGAPRVAVGSLRPIEGAPSGAWLRGGGGGGRGLAFVGPSSAAGGWIADAEGRIVGFLVAGGKTPPAGFVIPARAVRDLPAGGLVGLEDWNVQEYEGTPRYHRDRALALLEEKRYADSLGEFLALARQEPSQLPSLEGSLGAALLGAIEGARARARYGPLLGTVTELLDLAPDLGAARIHAARLHLEAGRYETAARLLLGMREIPPGSGEVVPGLVLRSYVEWGGSLLRVGRAREAASVYEEGLERTGRDPALLADLGRARMALGDYDGARVAMEEALVRDAGLAGVLEGELEDVYLHLGGEGILAVDIPKDSRLIPVEVLVSRGSSREIETMYIDSGASWSFLTRDFAARLGIQVDGRTRMAEFATANGRVTLPVVVLDEVNFRGFIVRDVEAAVGNLSEESFRGGVLGNNFLRHFSITIDRPRGKMTFEAVR